LVIAEEWRHCTNSKLTTTNTVLWWGETKHLKRQAVVSHPCKEAARDQNFQAASGLTSCSVETTAAGPFSRLLARRLHFNIQKNYRITMAGKKKSKKPAVNPARGFATTSVASKPRVDLAEAPGDNTPGSQSNGDAAAPPTKDAPQTTANSSTATATEKKTPVEQLSPEEFERQLEESALQILVEKYAQKVRKDAQRQKTRLETDRRLLRGAAESINTRKWLPQELMDHILGLIQAEGRFAASGVSSEGAASRLPQEEDLIIRLWTLQETLQNSGFPEDRIQPALHFILDIAPNIPYNSRSEAIWGLEEVLDWFARECSREELPDYSGRKTGSKSQAGMASNTPVSSHSNLTALDTPADTPSRTGTPFQVDPRLGKKTKGGALKGSRPASPKRPTVTYNEDIEPDELLPLYLETKTKLFAIERPRQDTAKAKGPKHRTQSPNDPEEALLLAKIDKVEKDVLFDKYVAEQQWRNKRIVLEKEYAAAKAAEKKEAAAEEPPAAQDSDDINAEADRIAAEVLAEDSDDGALADLFASLPVSEVDPVTGKTNTVMNGADGSKVTIRDFGKWTGVTPMRALEEACRARLVIRLFSNLDSTDSIQGFVCEGIIPSPFRRRFCEPTCR
jgi:ATP-dependent RNA helicase DHX29